MIQKMTQAAMSVIDNVYNNIIIIYILYQLNTCKLYII